MIEKINSGWGKELAGILALGIAVGLLFLPALTGRRGIFHDDQATAEFPWHYFLAHSFQNGIVPLWEPNTWCGAIPFYARYYADTYYFPLWPCFFLADLGNLDSSYWALALLPLLAHYLLAGGGMYVFARRGIRLGRPGAFLAAWVYLFSPAFSHSYVWFPIVVVQAWLPWFLLTVVGMDRNLGFRQIAAGAVTLTLMILAAQPPHAGYGLLLGFLLALALGINRFGKQGLLGGLRAPLQLALAVGLALGLSAVYWLSALDGARLTKQHLPSTYAAMTGGEGSMPPVYLATLFIPDLFGTLSGFNDHNWVESVTHGVRFWDANMSGGLLLSFLALVGLLGALRKGAEPGKRRWALFSAATWGLAVLCMLGRHTPFYALFWRGVPGLGLFPFPIRYRLLQVLATAWLAGLGLEWLSGRGRTDRPRAGLVWGFLGLAAALALAALGGKAGWAAGLNGKFSLPGWDEIVRKGQVEWFLGGPVLYFFAAAFCLVLAWRGFRGRNRVFLVSGLVMAETWMLAFAAFYFCIFRFHSPQPQQVRSLRPSSHPMVQRVLGLLDQPRREKFLRWASDQPFHDNFARFTPDRSWAFLGYDMKPLEKRFKLAFETAYECPVDWPIYWDKRRSISPNFLSNMSVGWLLDSRPKSPFPGGTTSRLETNPDFYLHRNPAALPRAFVLDRVVPASDRVALENLIGGNLRRAVFLEEGSRALAQARNRGLATLSGESGGEEGTGPHFAAFQLDNPVTLLALDNPNLIRAEVELTQPAILVFTETWYPGWSARVNGNPAEVLRVNFLQRGLLLPRGRHRIEMSFKPKAWQAGAGISLLSWLVLAILAVISVVRRRRAGEHRLPNRDGERNPLSSVETLDRGSRDASK